MWSKLRSFKINCRRYSLIKYPKPDKLLMMEKQKERQTDSRGRLECQSWRGCNKQLARHVWTILQQWHKWSGLRNLEFASDNNFLLANTYGPPKIPRKWTRHSTSEDSYNQIDYIMVRQRFRSSVNIVGTKSFPGADTGSDRNVVMVIYLRLKKNTNEQKTSNQIKSKFNPLVPLGMWRIQQQ